MPKTLDDDLSAEADETLETTEGSYTSGSAELSPALSWAAERFQFDPGMMRPQSGVESLQKWLIGHDATVALDAMLGPQTVAALERAYAAEQASAAAPESPAPGPRRKTAEQRPPEPDPVPPTGSETASARPVALSDSAISDIAQDRLGFRPYIEAVAEFILAEQTRPPLAIAINAPWGQGKTSFMNMLDAQLKQSAQGTTTRVATTWFNPWKYSEPEQVWAAFVANVTRCLRDNLTFRQSWAFKTDRFAAKLKRHADIALILRLAVAFIFVLLVLTLPFTLDLAAFHGALKDKEGVLGAIYEATKNLSGTLWVALFIPFALLSVLYGYVTFTKNLGLNLLEYVEKTDFKDKIGTLSQFESEMRRLADAVPNDLKIVVFIDDLDRCKGKVLGEIIEALQLADVSRTCVFVMAMDLKIVAAAIESERSELAHSVDRAASQMEHGRGYKFLEKIIQARLSLPAHGVAQMGSLVDAAMAPDASNAGAAGNTPSTAPEKTPVAGLGNRLREGIGLASKVERRTPRDSDSLIGRARHYGSRHFRNPRRLKRFINSLRLQTYLTAAVRPEAAQYERLARFLVLAERWPAVVDYMLKEEFGSEAFKDYLSGRGIGELSRLIVDELSQLPVEERKKLAELLFGPELSDPLPPDALVDLAEWCGFAYYRGIDAKGP